jgi:indoleamine 2,3-dioxygenase
MVSQWLPNQLRAVLDQLAMVAQTCSGEAGVEGIMELVQLQRQSLQKEVDKYCQER